MGVQTPLAGPQIWKLPVFIWVSLSHLDVQRKAKVFHSKTFFFFFFNSLALNSSLQISFKEGNGVPLRLELQMLMDVV